MSLYVFYFSVNKKKKDGNEFTYAFKNFLPLNEKPDEFSVRILSEGISSLWGKTYFEENASSGCLEGKKFLEKI